MKLHDVLKRFMALLLTFALMVGMVGTEALAAEYFPGSDGYTDSENDEGEVPEHIHNMDGWTCTKADDTRELTCTLEEHIHTDACYAPVEEAPKPICGKEEDPGHTHTDECYEEVTTYTCEQEESEGHKHTDECYGERPLICGQDEAEGHTHTDECYTTTSTLTCGQEEVAAHTHTDECYTTEQVLTCTVTEPEHEHTDECYTEQKTLTCGLEENEGHTHDDSCYTVEKVLTCELGESEGHHHTDACYGEAEPICGQEEAEGHKHTEECTKVEKKLICTEQEREGHTHTPECYAEANVPVLICGKEETLGHVHGESCYIEKQVLVCTLEEDHGTAHGDLIDADSGSSVTYTGHVHGPECYEVQKVLVCEKKEEEPHRHTAECYLDGVMPARGELICELPEHTHTDECYTVTPGEWTCVAPEEPQGDSSGIMTISGTTVILTSEDNGKEVQVNDGNVVVRGTWNGNIVVKGGTVNISGGTIDAKDRDASAIRIESGSVTIQNVTIQNGTGTNVKLMSQDDEPAPMEPRGDQMCRVGGGVYVQGGTLKFESGTIKDNTAQRGGGIFVNYGAKLEMTGGTVTKNKTVDKADDPKTAGEGGGIFVYGEAKIYGGKITYNECRSQTDLGGGGLYVSNSGIATIKNAKITENKAGGFGGGVAGCCHGEMSLVATDGVAMYNNTAEGTTFTQGDREKTTATAEIIDGHEGAKKIGITGSIAADFYTAGSCIVSNYMAGGGSAKYTGKTGQKDHQGKDLKIEDDNPIKIEPASRKTADSMYTGLKANPSEESIGKVPTDGVLIAYNSSTVNGGGIGCNGGLRFGTTDDYVTYSLEYHLEASKTLDGANPGNQQFTFQLLYKDKETVAGTAENNSDGKIELNFDDYIDYQFVQNYINSDNELIFYLKELVGNDTAISYDKSVYKVVVQLNKKQNHNNQTLAHRTDNNMFGPVTVTYDYYGYEQTGVKIYRVADRNGKEISPEELVNTGAKFENVKGGSLVVSKKIVGGGTAAQNATYSFKVTGQNYSKEFTITGEGEYTLEGLTAGEYIVKEIGSGVDTYSCQVTIADDGKAKVEVGQTTTVEVTNKFTPKTPAVIQPSVKKTVVGDVPDKEKFQFTLVWDKESSFVTPEALSQEDKDKAVQLSNDEVTIEGGGETNFEKVTFNQAGTYKFIIKEVEGNAPGYSYDPTVWTLTVVVTDNNGTLEVTSSEYTAGDKTDNKASFENIYKPTEISRAPKVKKTIEGDERTNQKQTFTFTLEADSSNKYEVNKPDPITIEDADEASFEAIKFEHAGIYKFKIKETNTRANGYTYDAHTWIWTVVVEDKGGKLAIVSDEYAQSNTAHFGNQESLAGTGKTGNCAEFVNHYKVEPTTYTPEVKKTVTGQNRPEEKPFTFTIEAVSSNPKGCELPDSRKVSIELDENGNPKSGTFDAINFTKAGTYKFLIKEKNDGLDGYIYDNSIFLLTVTVEDNDSHLKATGVYTKWDSYEEADGKSFAGGTGANYKSAEFVNEYKPNPATFTLKVNKEVTGNDRPAQKTFTFTIAAAVDNPENGAVMSDPTEAQIIVPVNGEVPEGSFGAIKFERAGTYTFEIKETDDQQTGYTYDKSVWTLTVTVIDNNGNLVYLFSQPRGFVDHPQIPWFCCSCHKESKILRKIWL